MGRMFRPVFLALALILATPLLYSAASAGDNACQARNNNTVDKLLACVTLEGVREHQAAFQAIAEANGGNRGAGTAGRRRPVDPVGSLCTDLTAIRDPLCRHGSPSPRGCPVCVPEGGSMTEAVAKGNLDPHEQTVFESPLSPVDFATETG